MSPSLERWHVLGLPGKENSVTVKLHSLGVRRQASPASSHLEHLSLEHHAMRKTKQPK